jgi:hypothetical protein
VIQRDTAVTLVIVPTVMAPVWEPQFTVSEFDNKEAKVQAIRHIVRPSLLRMAMQNPSFDQYERLLMRAQIVSDEERLFSRFQGSIYGARTRFSSRCRFQPEY